MQKWVRSGSVELEDPRLALMYYCRRRAMAVICENARGAVIDHLKYTNSVYARPDATVAENSADYRVQFKPDFFQIHAPFVMDSQFEKLHAKIKENVEDELREASNSLDDKPHILKRRKRKRKFDELSETEKVAIENHKQVGDILQIALKQLLTLAHSCNYLMPRTTPPKDNNLCARAAVKILDQGLDFIDLSQNRTKQEPLVKDALDIYHIQEDDPRIFNRMIHHHDDDVHVKKVLRSSYIFPPKCSFLMSDVSNLDPLISEGTIYDLIVLDPPWYNKSVRRNRKYRMLYDEDILQLPVNSLANPGCLVVVWATNNQQQHSFIKEEFFPRQGISYLARWFWLKVTSCGETVTEWHNEHKRPYETIFFGYMSSDQDLTDNHNHIHSDRTTPGRLRDIPDNFVLISIPSSLHSHKPPLGDVLKQYLPEQPRCLEMFARCLLPGWVSWGNEVLKLQHHAFYGNISNPVM